MLRLNHTRLFLASAVALACLSFAGCSKKEAQIRTEKLGAQVAVGQLTYTGIETEWREALDNAGQQRLPKNRFLIIHVSIANNAGEERAAPLLQLVDAKGETYAEVTDGAGVPDWLGYLRLLQPRESRSGRILFDVPQGPYKLRVASGGDPETEQIALIDLPMQLTPDSTHVSGTPTAAGVDESTKK